MGNAELQAQSKGPKTRKSALSGTTLITRLGDLPLRKQLLGHAFFRDVQTGPVSISGLTTFIGQWWHPLHYFPTFLARCISVLPDIESQSAVSRILSQETGEGNAGRAHATLYVETMERAGLSVAEITGTPPFPETKALVAGYRRASRHRFSALGFIFATEFADLAMVSGIGSAVTRATGVRDLEWVNIHVEQEPDHVAGADRTMLRSFSGVEASMIVDSAEQMWRLWIDFFDRLRKESVASGPVCATKATA